MLDHSEIISKIRRWHRIRCYAMEQRKRANLTQAQSDFLDVVRIAGAFKANLGDSGTAGRTISNMMLTNPKEAAKAFVVRRFIQGRADALNVVATQ